MDIAYIGFEAQGPMRMADAAKGEHSMSGVKAHGKREFRADVAPRAFGMDFGTQSRAEIHGHVSQHAVRFHVLLEHMSADVAIDSTANEADPPRDADHEIDA